MPNAYAYPCPGLALCQNATRFPVGSLKIPSEPNPGISCRGSNTVPPNSGTRAISASRSSLWKYKITSPGPMWSASLTGESAAPMLFAQVEHHITEVVDPWESPSLSIPADRRRMPSPPHYHLMESRHVLSDAWSTLLALYKLVSGKFGLPIADCQRRFLNGAKLVLRNPESRCAVGATLVSPETCAKKCSPNFHHLLGTTCDRIFCHRSAETVLFTSATITFTTPYVFPTLLSRPSCVYWYVKCSTHHSISTRQPEVTKCA